MNAGTVLFFEEFKFDDGSRKDKLLIVLNNPVEDEPYLVCPTTSQQHLKKKTLGCHSEGNYYYIDEHQDRFVKNTWIVFHTIYEFTASEVLSKKYKDILYEKFDLNPSLWKALKNCVLKSKDIEQDYLVMIARD